MIGNSVRGEVTFTAAGKDHVLVFDFNAIVAIEEEFDVDVTQIGDAIGKKMGSLRKVFRIGLSRHWQAVTEDEAGEIIGEIGPQKAGELVAEGFKRSFPQPAASAGTKARPPKARASTA